MAYKNLRLCLTPLQVPSLASSTRKVSLEPVSLNRNHSQAQVPFPSGFPSYFPGFLLNIRHLVHLTVSCVIALPLPVDCKFLEIHILVL